MIVIPNIYKESLSSLLGRDSSSLRSSEWQLPWATSLCHSERGRQPFVIPNRDLWPSVRNLLLLTRNGGDHTLAWREMLRYRPAWHTLGGWDSSVLHTSEWQANVIPNVCEEIPGYYWWEILRGSAPQNDIIQQRAITTNERFFLSTVVRMTVRLGWDSSLRLRSVQNDNRVIPSAREESLVTTTWGKILHFTSFHSEWQRCHSMRGR